MLKLQYFGHLMGRVYSLEKTLMLGKIGCRGRRGWQHEMVGLHHWLNGHEFEQAPRVGDGQGNLSCCSLWGHKVSDITEWLNNDSNNNNKKILESNTSCWGRGEFETLVHYWWECKMVQPLCKTIWLFLKKLNIKLLHNPSVLLLSIYINEMKSGTQTDNCIPKFRITLFKIVKRWKCLMCASTSEWINKMRYMHMMEYYSAMKILIHAATWILKHYAKWNSVQFSCSVMSDSLRPHELQHTRPPCPSPTSGVHPNPCPLSRWCHPTNSSSVVPFSCPQSFPASGSFPMSSSSHQVPKVLEFQLQHQSFQWTPRTDPL